MRSCKLFKIIIIFSIAAILFTAVPFYASAAVANYESENNNTIATADVTYDDYNNYGTLDISDIDYWKITMPTNGLGAIWLGNIPAGCDFDIHVYSSESEGLLASSS